MSKRRRPERDEPPKPWWRNFSVAMALVGLLVTLTFNTIGTWQGAKSAEEGKVATSLGLLSSLNASTIDAVGEINSTPAFEHACDEVPFGKLEDSELAAIGQALDHYDYLAFLLAGDYVTLAEAENYWRREMVEAYWLAERFNDPGQLKIDHPYLWRFYQRAPKRLRPGC